MWGISKITPLLIIAVFALAVIVSVAMFHNDSTQEAVPTGNSVMDDETALVEELQPTHQPTSAPTPTLTPTPTPSPAPGMLRMNMKSYGNHNPTYDSRILAVKPELVIDNPPHGLYGEMEEEEYPGQGYTANWLLQNVAGYQAAGIKVIGYISGGYEGRGGDDGYAATWYSLDMNKKLITNMATLDHVDGVFIDECSDFPNAASKAYLKALSDHARSYGLIVWMNTGVDNFDEWYFTANIADFMQSSEAWRGQSPSPVQAKWGSRIGVTGFNSQYTAQDAYNLTINAWCKCIRYCYINTVEYISIAPWFEEYAQMLRSWDGSYP